MAEYIKREAVIDRLKRNLDACNPDTFSELCYRDAIETVKWFPAAEVAPVVHGKWLRSDDDWDSLTTIRCSICGEEWCFEMIDDITLLNYKHCPNCGARMDGADNG